MSSAMTPDERHADVVARFPGGLTPAQFIAETLASADEDGKLDPPSLADPFAAMSLLMGLYMKGVIERRGPEPRKSERTGPWYLADERSAAPTPLTGATKPNVPDPAPAPSLEGVRNA